MTREDAIRILKDEGRVDGSEEFIEAYYMGIKALEQNESAEKWYKLFVEKLDKQEPCDDAISREAAIKALSHGEGCRNICANAIRQLPSVTQKSVHEQIRAEIDGIDINGQVDEHTMFIRTGEQVKQMALEIIDRYTK